MIHTLLVLGGFLGTLAQESPPKQPVLEFRVLEADGSRARVDVNRAFDGQSLRRVLSCVRCPPGDRPDPWNATPEGAPPKSYAGVRAFLVEAGERYVYAYSGIDILPVEGEITIARDAPLTTIELCAIPQPMREQLRIRLTQPDGRRLEHDFQVTIESVEYGLPLFRWQRWRRDVAPRMEDLVPSARTGGDTVWSEALPLGRYRIRIETDENSPMCGTGWEPEPAPFGDWTDYVELREGAPRDIEARMWLGGRLRLALDLPAGMSPREESWTKQHPYDGNPLEYHWLGLGTRGPAARVTLRPDPDAQQPLRERGTPDVSDVPVKFWCRPQLMISYEFSALLPGREQTSADWIPPGAYIVRVEARDFAPIEGAVRIHAGETSQLRLQLAAR